MKKFIFYWVEGTYLDYEIIDEELTATEIYAENQHHAKKIFKSTLKEEYNLDLDDVTIMDHSEQSPETVRLKVLFSSRVEHIKGQMEFTYLVYGSLGESEALEIGMKFCGVGKNSIKKVIKINPDKTTQTIYSRDSKKDV